MLRTRRMKNTEREKGEEEKILIKKKEKWKYPPPKKTKKEKEYSKIKNKEKQMKKKNKEGRQWDGHSLKFLLFLGDDQWTCNIYEFSAFMIWWKMPEMIDKLKWFLEKSSQERRFQGSPPKMAKISTSPTWLNTHSKAVYFWTCLPFHRKLNC